jgi:transcriptional regulator NrdR family protein
MDAADVFVSSRDTDTHRVCGTCNQLKPLSAFYRDGKDSNGKIKYRRDCKDCYKRIRMYEAALKKRGKQNALPIVSKRPRK